MANDWKDWTPEMVEAHNAKVRGESRQLKGKDRTCTCGLTMWREDDGRWLCDCGRTIDPKPPNLPSKPTLPESKGKGRGRTPNKTEQAYMNALAMEFPGADIRYEPITFHMSNGHSYTPDIGVWHSGVIYGVILIEVKNAAYKHASYGRAQLAYDQCRQEFDMFSYRWAEKTSDGWRIKEG